MTVAFAIQEKNSAQAPQRFFSGSPMDIPLAESDNFVVVPSLGSIVPGWVLIVPKCDALNFSEIDPNLEAELLTLTEYVREKINVIGETITFEHGATSQGSITGCGVDQAHIHIVPFLHAPFHQAIERADMKWTPTSAAPPIGENLRSDYYWFATPQAAAIAHASKPESQWFRKRIAAISGQPDMWDYRKHPCWSNIEMTIELFR